MKTSIITEVSVCRECHGHAEEKFSGDEGWTICNDCGAIECGYKTMYECQDCLQLYTEEVTTCDCETT
jgi:hypothetical protein